MNEQRNDIKMVLLFKMTKIKCAHTTQYIT